MIALNDREVLTSNLGSKTLLASWFSNKLVNGNLRWCKLNEAIAMDKDADGAAGAATGKGDDSTVCGV